MRTYQSKQKHISNLQIGEGITNKLQRQRTNNIVSQRMRACYFSHMAPFIGVQVSQDLVKTDSNLSIDILTKF